MGETRKAALRVDFDRVRERKPNRALILDLDRSASEACGS